MIKCILPMVLAAFIAPCFSAEGWINDDMDAAKKQAAEQKKGILIEFTGSSWVPACKALREQVLRTPDFIKEVGQDFILLSLDYPDPDTPPQPGKEGNLKYLEAYGISGYPTLIYTDAKGKALSGAMGGCPKAAVLALKEDAKRRMALINAAEAKLAAAKTDDEKIEALGVILKYAPDNFIDYCYDAYRSQLLDLDKNDKSGYRAEQARKEVVRKEVMDMQLYFREKGRGITDIEEGLKIVRNYPNRDKLQPESQQNLLLTECKMLESAGADTEVIFKLLDKAIELGPETDFGRMAADGKKWLQFKKDHPEAK